jgi:hypothetical protein
MSDTAPKIQTTNHDFTDAFRLGRPVQSRKATRPERAHVNNIPTSKNQTFQRLQANIPASHSLRLNMETTLPANSLRRPRKGFPAFHVVVGVG